MKGSEEMDQVKIEWIAVNDITVRHEYLPKEKTAAKKYSIFMKDNRPLLHVYRNQYDELLLVEGIDAYNSFMAINPDKQIPIFITNEELTELDWTFKLLHTCYIENVYSLIKYEYTMLLLEETSDGIKRICTKVGCSKEELLKYKIDKMVPNKYKELAIEHKRQVLVNEICRNPKFEVYRPLLYEMAFQTSNRLTQEKLKIFQHFLDSGYHLNVNSPDALVKLNKVLDKKQALKTYWDSFINPNSSFERRSTFQQKVYKENNSIRIRLK